MRDTPTKGCLRLPFFPTRVLQALVWAHFGGKLAACVGLSLPQDPGAEPAGPRASAALRGAERGHRVEEAAPGHRRTNFFAFFPAAEHMFNGIELWVRRALFFEGSQVRGGCDS